MRNFKNVPYYILGKGSFSELGGLLEPKRNNENSTVVFLVDDFFANKNIKSRLPFEKNDILIFVSTKEEPKAEYIDQLADEIKLKLGKILPVAIIGMGGGTVMDISKCVSILLTNEGKAEDYQGWDLVKNPAIYKIGIPTISGTGAEASRTGVLTSKKIKLGMNSDYSMFDQIILDPELLETVPTEKMIYTAMDCYIHDVELLKGNNSGITRALASQSLSNIREFFESQDYEKLMVASYLGGCAMSTAVGGHVCHPVSYGLSLVLGTRHGLSVCLCFNGLEDYYPEDIGEFRAILSKFKVELPKNVTKNATEEQFEKMAEAVLKNEKPLQNAFGDNWREIFNKEKVKEILKKI